jgi:hypothetical protein
LRVQSQTEPQLPKPISRWKVSTSERASSVSESTVGSRTVGARAVRGRVGVWSGLEREADGATSTAAEAVEEAMSPATEGEEEPYDDEEDEVDAP